jgi:hypothetical protein
MSDSRLLPSTAPHGLHVHELIGRTHPCFRSSDRRNTIMSLDPTGRGKIRWTMRWKTALNAVDITFDGRLSAARH